MEADGGLLKGLEAHLTNLALNQAGLIEYQFLLDPVRDAFCRHEQSALTQIVEALVLRIRHMRTQP